MGEAIPTVLIVDDEADVSRYLSAALEDAGFRVVVAADAETGLRRIESDRPDLVCLDLVLPGPTGLSLYREIREAPEHRDLPVVVVTGISPADAAARLSLGTALPWPDAYVEKPVDLAKLLAAVRGLAPSGGRT